MFIQSLFLKTPLHLLVFFSVIIFSFVVQPFQPCTTYPLLYFLPLLDLSPTFRAYPALTVLLSAPQYSQCRFSVGGIRPLLCSLLFVGSGFSVLLVCICVISVWRLQDAESIPQFDLELPSDLRYSQLILLVPYSPHLFLACAVQFEFAFSHD